MITHADPPQGRVTDPPRCSPQDDETAAAETRGRADVRLVAAEGACHSGAFARRAWMAGRRCDARHSRDVATAAARRERASGGEGARVSCNTVREYIAWFEAEKLLPGNAAVLPTAAELDEPTRARRAGPRPPPRLMPYRDDIGIPSAPGCRSRSPGSGSRRRTRTCARATPRSVASCGE
jgi:hypothetical protein